MSENWDRIQDIFLQAADLPAAERRLFLDQACHGDAALLGEVESLLEADAGSEEFISGAVETEARLLVETSSPIIGQRLGAYRVLREIGRGGMGTVYLASRDDEQYQKQVAIKVVKRGMDSADVLARFRAERQILASLDHPSIARLLDAGTTSSGQPFFVMEYVEGVPLDAYCRRNHPSVAERLGIFLHIAAAVAYAHRSLIVHRDLKPGNILVNRDGLPKLLDFGVAKLLNAGDRGLTETVAVRRLTPEYASPEQVRGLPVTTSSDVYALGVILFEMLTGERAQSPVSRSPIDLERAICEVDIPRPSAKAKGIDQDLDNIVLMATRKDAERRYSSVDHLAEDVRRYLDGRPVVARQDSFAYRAGKFVRRNRLRISAAALVLLSLVAGLLLAVSSARDARAARQLADAQRLAAEHERSRAEAKSAEAEKARSAEAAAHLLADQKLAEAVAERAKAENRFGQLINLSNRTLFDVHDAIERLPGALRARGEIVKTTLDYLELLQKDHDLDYKLRIALSAAYLRVGQVQGGFLKANLGDTAGAIKSYRKAIALVDPLYRIMPNDEEVLFAWVDAHVELAALIALTDRDEGIRLYRKALIPAHRLAGIKPFRPSKSRSEGTIHNRLSDLYQSFDRTMALEEAYLQKANIERSLAYAPDDALIIHESAMIHSQIASRLVNMGRLEEAAANYRKSLEIREQLLAKRPEDIIELRGKMITLANYAGVLGLSTTANLGLYEEARRHCLKALEIARAIVKADAQNLNARYDLAMSLIRLASAPGAPQLSIDSAAEAIAVLRRLVTASGASDRFSSTIAMAFEQQGLAFEAQGRLAEAAAALREALGPSEALRSASPANFAAAAQSFSIQEHLSQIKARLGDPSAVADAQKTVAAAEALGAKAVDPDRAKALLAMAIYTLAVVQHQTGNPAEARNQAVRALAVWNSMKDTAPRILYLKQFNATGQMAAGHFPAL